MGGFWQMFGLIVKQSQTDQKTATERQNRQEIHKRQIEAALHLRQVHLQETHNRQLNRMFPFLLINWCILARVKQRLWQLFGLMVKQSQTVHKTATERQTHRN